MGDLELENVTFWPNITDVFTMEHLASLVANSTSGIFDHDLTSSAEPTGEECYDRPDGIDAFEFTRFERNMGGYATCAVGLFGIIGNMINLGVLSHREMRGNCFNQLLIGKFKQRKCCLNSSELSKLTWDLHSTWSIFVISLFCFSIMI